MDSENFMHESFPQDKAQEFADILRDAISSYIDNQNSCTASEWLNNYLSQQIPNKSAEEILNITNTIINTVALHEETIISMRDAIESGKSIEAWFQKETISSENSVGQQAYNLVEAHESLTGVSNQYSEPNEQHEIIDVEVISPEEWEDRNWNKYKMKALVFETVQQAGEVALKTTASDLYEKVAEYGFQTVLIDKEIIKESVINGVSTGLKVATAGAMEISKERGILLVDESDTESRSLIVCMAIENVKTLSKVSKGKIGFTEGLSEIKNTSIATLATIIKTKVSAIGSKIGSKMGATVGTVFGPVGTAVGSFVGGVVGKMAGTNVGSKIVETAKKVRSSAKSVVSKVTSMVRSAGSKIKSGLKKLFSW